MREPSLRCLVFIDWPVKAWCIPDTHVDALRQRFPDVEFLHARTREEAARLVREADVAFTPSLTPEMVASASRLRWVHSSAAAVQGLLPLDALAARDIQISNARGVQAVAIAEHVMGGLLVLSRRFDRTIEAQRARKWIQNDLIHDWPWLLSGKRATIVGLGTIGMEVAKRAHAFGMNITGIRRHADRPRPGFIDRVLSPNRLDESLDRCDVLILAAPGVEATKRIIGAAQLARMNRGSVLVNVARGQVVDEAAMTDALRSGQLRGAVLDVFDQEPLPPDHVLWTFPNVVITPHSSGFRAEHWDEVTAGFARNLEHFQRGEPLDNPVDAAAGY